MKFCKETDFQEELMIGKVSSDWDIVKLEEVLWLLRNGLTTTQNKEGNGYPVTRIETISEECIDPNKVGYIHNLSESEIDEYKLRDGDILFSHINSLDHIGKTAIYEGKPELIIHGMNLLLLRPDKEKIHPIFLLHLLRFYRMKNIFRAMAKKAVNQASINQTELGRIKILLPPLDEQRAIAGVLGVVDSVIAKTGEVIAKTERLKKGLMQTLLTRGIGHKEYKQTPIGTIPKEWEVVKVEDVAEIRRNKSINDFEKIAFIPMELIPDSQIFAKYEIKAKEDVRSFTYCEAGDLLLAKITPSLENGKQGIVPSDVPNKIALATTEVFPICCKGINRLFLFYVLKFSKFRNKIISSMIGTTGRQRASKESVERLEIPLPPIEEQQKIAEILSDVDKKLELERNEKARLERIKRGLMDLLLTGKIRVRVD